MSIELRPYRLPLAVPLHASYRSISDRTGTLVSLAEGGLTGWGDACPMLGWSTHSVDDVTSRLVAAATQLESELFDDVLEMLHLVPEARAALAGAAHDLAAQRAGVPLAALLDDGAGERVRANASIGSMPTARAVEEAEWAVATGFTAMKLKVGAEPPEADVARVEAIRRAIGDDVELRLDANGAWDVDTAIATLDRLGDVGIAFCEEPARGIEAIAAVGAQSAVRVAVDESARSIPEIERAVQTGSIAVVIVKPQALGGPDVAMRAVDVVRAAGALVVVTSMIDSAIGVAHAVHVAAAAGADTAHGVATSHLLADDVAGALPIEDGHVLVPSVPGLGVSPR